MDIIRFTINNPVKVAVGVILSTLFGILALFSLPIQLTPNVDEPRVTVTTLWQGKSAREIEREIVDRQEEKLKGVPNLRKLTSTAQEGRAEVALEFFVGTDKHIALRDTDQKLNQVTGYPIEAEKPEVVAADSAMESPIAWLILRSLRGEDPSTLRDFVWDNVKPLLERVPGLASVDVFGGRERELHVLIDPAVLASKGLTLQEVESALRGQNVNVSAGTIEVGKRDLIYRTVGEYESTAQVEKTVIAIRDGGPIHVRDVGRVELTYEKDRGFVRSKGERVLGLPVRRESGANVVSVMRGLREQLVKVNEEVLKQRGMALELTQVYDETVYIDSSIGLVRQNLVFGGILASLVLLVFLRNIRATAVVVLSIPISVISTCLAVSLFGRTINVVMLAGMAFAVGMVVDNAIVVLENIFRHKQTGKSSFQAAYDGASEVWGAVLASTLTTMVVFIPVIFIQEEAGQLFRDISIAISAGVGISLLVSVLVIPTLAARILGKGKVKGNVEEDHSGGRLGGWIADGVSFVNRHLVLRLAVIALFVVGSAWGSKALMPPTDYLPGGNRNLVFGSVITEPGLGVTTFENLAKDVEAYLRPYWEAKPGSPEQAALPAIDMPVGGQMTGAGGATVKVKAPALENFFFVTRGNTCFMGVTSQDPMNVKPLEVLLNSAVMSSRHSVGSMAFFRQASLFGSVRRGGGSVDLEIRGESLAKVEAAAGVLKSRLMGHVGEFGFPQASPGSFDLPRPEIRALPDLVRAADVGLTVRDVGFIVAAAVDGAFVGNYQDQGDEIDLLVKLEDGARQPIRDVKQVPVYAPIGAVIPLSAVVDFAEVGAPQEISHIEEMPAVTLQLAPPPGVTVEEVVNGVTEKVIEPLRATGAIDPSVIVALAGNADKLAQTRAAMFGHWTGWNGSSLRSLIESRGFIALLIVYLLMAALYESFLYPLPIMLTVPLATVGGFAGLRLVYWLSMRNPVTPIQQLDVVTMLGFVILVGIVVNNAILLVDQTLNNLRYGMDPQAALHESVRTRVRPIFMTALTTIFGQLPLALMPGAGSELYRGLAAVMVGGLLVATVFTLILVPLVFSMFLSLRIWMMKLAGRDNPFTGDRVVQENKAGPRVLPEPLPAESGS